MLTDELADMREEARKNKNFRISDIIRNELDSRGSFAFDTDNGQVIYHLGPVYTREQVSKDLVNLDIKFL